MDIPRLLVPESLSIVDLKWEDNTLIVYSDTRSVSARCPWCQQISHRVHSRYHRTLADLPCGGRQVYLQVTLRKFYCINAHCSGKVFAQRLDGVTRVYARRTDQQQHALEAIALALGGEAGARLAARLGIPLSPDYCVTSGKCRSRQSAHPPYWA
jgi:transposase